MDRATRRTGLLLIGLGVGIALIGVLVFVFSSGVPVFAPAIFAVGTLAFWWGGVLAVPENFRRIATILMIIGTIWTVACATIFTTILARISN